MAAPINAFLYFAIPPIFLKRVLLAGGFARSLGRIPGPAAVDRRDAKFLAELLDTLPGGMLVDWGAAPCPGRIHIQIPSHDLDNSACHDTGGIVEVVVLISVCGNRPGG